MIANIAFRWIFVGVVWALGTVVALADGSVPCSAQDLSVAQAAQSDAKGTVDSVLHFLDGGDAASQQLVVRWFGADDQPTIDQVHSVLGQVSSWVSTMALYCVYSNDGSLVEEIQAPDGSIKLVDRAGGTYAYVDPGDLTKINLGLKFFKAPPTGEDSQLGTIVHEMTHFFITGDTGDDRYGKDDCLDLARRDPAAALKNADNYEYFIEEWLAS